MSLVVGIDKLILPEDNSCRILSVHSDHQNNQEDTSKQTSVPYWHLYRDFLFLSF